MEKIIIEIVKMCFFYFYDSEIESSHCEDTVLTYESENLWNVNMIYC